MAAGLGADLGVAAAAFVGTNVDNCVVTMAMVAGAPLERAHRIAAGQVIGFAVLVAVSAAAAAVLFEFSTAVVGLLGLVPLAIGVRGLVGLARPTPDEVEPGGNRLAAGRRRGAGGGARAAGRRAGASRRRRWSPSRRAATTSPSYIPLFRVGGATNVGAIVGGLRRR